MEMEQMMAYLLAEIRTNQEEMKENIRTNDANLKEMKEEMTARLEASLQNMKAKIKANNEKFEVLQGTLVSWMDIHQASTEAIPEEITAKMDAHQERMEASMDAQVEGRTVDPPRCSCMAQGTWSSGRDICRAWNAAME
jgi:hypothetical protein